MRNFNRKIGFLNEVIKEMKIYLQDTAIATILFENEIGLNLISENEEKVFVEQKIIDPRERARKKFQMIAKRTKSWRIREKNIKRLVDYYD